MRKLAAAILLFFPTTPTSTIVVPAGWVAEPYLYISGPVGLRRDAQGKLLVGALNVVVRDDGAWTPIATGTFLATAIDVAPDGTVYVADAFWTSWGIANLWAAPPGQTAVQQVATGFRYCEGVLVLPNGDVLAVDVGWINQTTYLDGKIHRIPPGTWGANTVNLPVELATPLRNPVSVELGPDGWIYFLDRGFLVYEPGTLYRFKPGDTEAQAVLTGLNDPFDTAWAPDGSLFITDTLGGTGVLLRWVPSTGALETWASGFLAPHGIDVAPNGDVFVADLGAGIVYRIHPVSVEVPMSLEPETLNLKSNGQTVLARVMTPGPVSGVQIVSIDGSPVAPIAALSVMLTSNGIHAKFSRAALQAVLTTGVRLVRLEGVGPSGPFHAEATVKVIP